MAEKRGRERLAKCGDIGVLANEERNLFLVRYLRPLGTSMATIAPDRKVRTPKLAIAAAAQPDLARRSHCIGLRRSVFTLNRVDGG